MAITRTPMIDDDGSGTTGTVINNAWKVELYDQIDAALATGSGYLEGTFVPSLSFGGAAVGLTYATRAGIYVKIGRLVWVQVQVTLSAKGSSAGAAQLDGLPHTPLIGAWGGFLAAWTAAAAGLTGPVQGYVFTNGAPSVFLTMAGATGQGGLTDAHFTNTTDLVLVGTYRAGA